MAVITGLDVETTGLEFSDGHKIIELAIVMWDFPSMTVKAERVWRFNPERAISAKAQEIHGITYEELADKPLFAEFAPTISKILDVSDLVIAHNADFDIPFIKHELEQSALFPKVKSFCTMKNSRWATPLGKNSSLKELCFALGIEYDLDKAHGALYDVQVMMAAFKEAHRMGFFQSHLDAVKEQEALAA
ncbi:DnaQ DNA polymerase III, epsilon subunit and related 3'-5' exonucleases [uncultured Caudovirales phage]|uniref:DnaQ DNA polymerase III, epsilon subunit and related 3'-5' exonucleases n=1 Tax=uncultured Caudovirales phage TaxID=2100421 RepID=A0A6J5KNS1_9CAUD|nr:DnaQ DNA polymerase III, epsilon subunit and related 3'-5' exonucleases [uncultured Caudovirales phage]CAB4123865.1 DnaQ DNA polymerase III, epsilon subunit and related 3'-5' exonucleases [uncultured Caudovirales phage]CAB5219306.1 DnaQ DNA polymerase III, epsilon subunit and related 3'-5' exonucleases [uncultured Caudovirales phage]